MKRIITIAATALLLVLLVVLMLFGYRTIQARDAAMMKIVRVVNGLDEVEDTLTLLNGGTVRDRNWESAEEERARKLGLIDPDVELEEEEAENTASPAEATPEASPSATPAATNRPNPTATPRPAGTTVTAAPARTARPSATATPRPTNAPAATSTPANTSAPGPIETDPGSDVQTPPATDDPVVTAPPGTDPPSQTEHVHNWVTETIAESGHYESRRTGSTTVVTGYTTVVDSEGWTEYLDGQEIYHEPITHQEPIYSEQDVYEDVWVVDTPASSRTYCSICGAAG